MELDDAYANATHIENGATYPDRWAAAAAGFREGMLEQGLAELDISYGDRPREVFDLFLPDGQAKGLMIFVHGGYWLRFDKSFWSHLAAGALEQGWAVAMPSYDLCPEVRIADITRQIAHMIPQAAAMVAGPIVLAGHSAGGHLVARMAMPGMLPADVAIRVARIMPISPVADLRPMVKTSMNADFKMEMADAAMESPTLMLPMPGMDIVVWVGAEERPAFLEQATALAEAWRCDCVVDPGRHHFDVIEGLADPASRMMKRLLPD
ncbi:Alpha/beta hydrolase family protein [Thalassovita gelatinovora]|uniref:Alpha/beta hydrolase family protein n=1 Tax=Thalassovita gelatinovora TaxID=53501 RepID=A0A0P1F5P2_THAGE|nr:alpha/beta hydrolase [Thalassovita gelatinovora]QIZ80804.1 alpha/beta hydrolase [Thalassovita gelatinovora]CUH63198.1 Alpha/beta hydrolase family protein [Thalassovita gelatinovora]SEQ63310.1 Acetyl esterase/lipase [Thalassovita gelatinovora]